MSSKIIVAAKVLDRLKYHKPTTKLQLKNYVKVFIGIDIPDKTLCDNHSTPMQYLWHCFNEKSTSENSTNDCVVWANRAGGKTLIAAIATVLDCIFKPGCKVRILAGSYEQASRMYSYITDIISRKFRDKLKGKIRKSGCSFVNGSDIELLTQSAKSVRGSHIHKLRCDEIELFDRDVFDAAKFITKSSKSITGSMEILSTMHKPYGLMNNVVSQAVEQKTPIFKWCIWEVIEKCVDRSCSRCPINDLCQGRAKKAVGYLKIDDCIAMARRSSISNFQSEMLCEKPNLENIVFAEFDPEIHIKNIRYNPNLPLYRCLDFGYVNPFVCLFIQIDQDLTVRIFDEYYESKKPISVHAQNIRDLTPCDESKVAGTFCDPAGAARNDVTGTSPVRELANLGIRTKYRRSGILQGIELIRSALKNGQGQSSIIVNSKCTRLIEALQCYHYPDATKNPSELPFKDGLYDHPIDALRYFFVNYKNKPKTICRRY